MVCEVEKCLLSCPEADIGSLVLKSRFKLRISGLQWCKGKGCLAFTDILHNFLVDEDSILLEQERINHC
jgi:hypothetical protein